MDQMLYFKLQQQGDMTPTEPSDDGQCLDLRLRNPKFLQHQLGNDAGLHRNMYTIIFAIKCGVHGGLNGAVKHGSHQEMFLGKVILFSYLSEFNQVYDELQLLKT